MSMKDPEIRNDNQGSRKLTRKGPLGKAFWIARHSLSAGLLLLGQHLAPYATDARENLHRAFTDVTNQQLIHAYAEGMAVQTGLALGRRLHVPWCAEGNPRNELAHKALLNFVRGNWTAVIGIIFGGLNSDQPQQPLLMAGA
jgi:hypothetical protein